jgi:hypothetical protein
LWASRQWDDRTHHDGKAADEAHVYWAGTLMFGRVAMIIEPLRIGPAGRTVAAFEQGGPLYISPGCPAQPWLGGRQDALLVPPTTTQIRTEWPGEQPQEVNVP